MDARWVAQIAAAFRTAGGDGALSRLPDAAIEASLRAAGLGGGRESVTFDSPVAFGFPATSGYADDPVNTASGNFLIAETDLPVGALAAGLTLRRTYNSRSDRAGAFGPGWSSLGRRATAGPRGRRRIRRTGRAAGAVPPAGRRLRARHRRAGRWCRATPTGLLLRWFDGRTWEFDRAGRPVTLDGGPGTAVSLTYADGRLHRMTHAGGRSVTLTWTGERITAAAAADGRRVDYAYADGVLVTAGDRRYEVDDHGRVVAVTDADGVVEAATPTTPQGRVVEQVSRFGRRTRFAYLPGRVTVTIGDEEDSPANTYVHDGQGRLLAVVDGHGQRLSRTYDEWGNPVTVTDRNGAVTTVAWDEWSRPVRRVEPGGAAFDYTLRRCRPGAVGGGVHRRDRPVPVRRRRAYPRGSGRRRRRSHPARGQRRPGAAGDRPGRGGAVVRVRRRRRAGVHDGRSRQHRADRAGRGRPGDRDRSPRWDGAARSATTSAAG